MHTHTHTHTRTNTQKGRYATMQQQFSQFPSQEYAWNLADEILLGNMMVDTSSNNKYVHVFHAP